MVNPEQTISEENFLNDIWNIYFHDPYDTNWNTNSYIRLGNISSTQEFWMHHKQLRPRVHQGMFFLMREYVFPMWDAEENIDGGCLSIKVLKENMPMFWEDLSIKLLGETLLKEQYRDKWNIVNGISTSPKKHFCIIKIWMRDDSLNSKDYFDIMHNYYGDILYKSNRDNITCDSTKRAE
jgi:hypothetical protein